MATTLTYAGVQLKHCHTLAFDQAVEYDSSGADVLYHKFRIKVETVSTAASLAADLGVTISGESSSIFAQLEARLMQSRRKLIYKVGDKTLVESNGFNPGNKRSRFADVNNGPKPLKFEITKIAGEIINLSFEIETCVVLCSASSQGSGQGVQARIRSGGHVLSNKWSLSDSLSPELYNTRTWSGVLRCSHPTYPAHMWRALCIPPLLAGYKREDATFVQSPDGLTLNYTIKDVQTYAAPPFPATKWQAEHTEMVDNGRLTRAKLDIMLEGPPQALKSDLLIRGAQIVHARLGDTSRLFKEIDPKAGDKPLVTRFIYRDSLHANRITMSVEVLRTTVEASRFLNLSIGKFAARPFLEQSGVVPNYNHLVHPVPYTFEPSSPAGIYVSLIQDPCTDNHAIPAVAQLNPQTATGTARLKPKRVQTLKSQGNLPTEPPTGYSPEHQGAPYVDVEAWEDYKLNRMKVSAPIATSKPKQGEATVAVGSLGGDHAVRKLYYRARRIGAPPAMPEAAETRKDPSGKEEELMDSIVKHYAPQLMPDGKTMIYSSEQVDTYAVKRLVTDKDTLRRPSLPADASEPKNVRVQIARLKKEID